MKILDLDTKIEELSSKIQSYIALSPDNLYTTVFSDLTNKTRFSQDQLTVLESFEHALSTYVAASKSLHSLLDIHSLEHRTTLFEKENKLLESSTSTSYGKDLLGGELGTLLTRFENKESTSSSISKESAQEYHSLKLQETSLKLFVNKFSLAFAGHVGLSMLGEDPVSDIKPHGLLLDSLKQDISDEELASTLSSFYNEALGKVIKATVSPQDLNTPEKRDALTKDYMTKFFSNWTNEYSLASFQDLNESRKLDQIKLVHGNYSMIGDDFKKRSSLVIVKGNIIKSANVKDLIGYTDFREKLGAVFDKAYQYDFERQENLFNPPFSVFVMSNPGFGKSFMISAKFNEAAEYCRKHNIPATFETHSITDYASHFQNQTANQLNLWANSIANSHGLHFIYVPDADTIYQSRNSSHITPEMTNTMNVYFKIFDGSIIPKDGRVIFFQDANTSTGIDKATRDRVMDLQLELNRFTEPDLFAQYVQQGIMRKVKLPRGTDFWIPQNKMTDIGQLLVDDGELSLRSIGHIINTVAGDIPITKDVKKMNYDQKVSYIQNHIQTNVTYESLRGEIESYATRRKAFEQANYLKEQELIVDAFRDNLDKDFDGAKKGVQTS